MQAHAISFPSLLRDAKKIGLSSERLGITIRKYPTTGEALFGLDVGMKNELKIPTFSEVLHSAGILWTREPEDLLAIFSRFADGSDLIVATVAVVEDHKQKELVLHHRLLW